MATWAIQILRSTKLDLETIGMMTAIETVLYLKSANWLCCHLFDSNPTHRRESENKSPQHGWQ